jgi:hypothetical protein
LYQKSKAQKNIPSHGFSTHFCIGTTREAVLPNTSRSFFFCKEAVFREVEAEAKAVLVGAVPKGP